MATFITVFQNSISDGVSTEYTPSARGRIDVRLIGDLGGGIVTMILIHPEHGEVSNVLDFSQGNAIIAYANRTESFRFEIDGTGASTNVTMYFSYYSF